MEERNLDNSEHDEAMRERDVDRGNMLSSHSQPPAMSMEEERARDRNSRTEVKSEVKSKDCQLFPNAERGVSHFASTLQSQAMTGMQDESHHAQHSEPLEGVRTHRQGVRTHPQPSRPELYVYVKEEPQDDYPSTSNCPTPSTRTDKSPSKLSAGAQEFSIRIKQEPRWSENLPHVFYPFVEENNAVGKDLHPDLSSSRTVCGDIKNNWLKLVLPTEHVHPPVNKIHTSPSGSGASPHQIPHGFTGINNTHNFQEKFTLASGDNRSLEDQEQTETFSDDSDCETLPIHFEPQEDGLGGERLYECGMCQIAFDLPAQVHEHVTQHDITDRCYVCSRCKMEFPQIAFLTQHMPVHTFSEGTELHYDNPKSFVCHVCSKVFRRLYELNRHQKIHSGLKPFMCDVCHKMFARGDELTRHRKVHSGERPFSCHECSRAFITNHELTQHKKSHGVDKPFICHICNRGFIRADKLVHHHQKHAGERPYVCDVCEKGFITASELRQHLKIHSGVKPFVCEVCCKAYLKVNDLKRHMKMHTGVKPFTCDVCGKAFHRTDVLTRHKKIHSKVKRGKKSLKCDTAPRHESLCT